MEGPTFYHRLRGPSPTVWAMRTRLAPPPPIADPFPLPCYPPPPPPPPPPQPAQRRRRGRPRLCDRLPPPPGFALPAPPPQPQAPRPALAAHGQAQFGGLQPHVLRIDAGQDIVPRIIALAEMKGRAVCILSVIGVVQEATLLLSSGVTSNQKGPLEIILLSGSILTWNDHGCLHVTLASADSSVIGGIIAGPLIAATHVQAIVGSFHIDEYRPNKIPKIIAHYPNSQRTISNGSTLSSERANPGYTSCSSTRMEHNESSEIDVKPSLEELNLFSL